MACGGCKKNKNTQTGNKSAASAPKVSLFNINDKVYTLSSNGKIGNQTRWKYTARYVEDVREVNGAVYSENQIFTYDEAKRAVSEKPEIYSMKNKNERRRK